MRKLVSAILSLAALASLSACGTSNTAWTPRAVGYDSGSIVSRCNLAECQPGPSKIPEDTAHARL